MSGQARSYPKFASSGACRRDAEINASADRRGPVVWPGRREVTYGCRSNKSRSTRPNRCNRKGRHCSGCRCVGMSTWLPLTATDSSASVLRLRRTSCNTLEAPRPVQTPEQPPSTLNRRLPGRSAGAASLCGVTARGVRLSGAAVPAASTERLLRPPLRAFRCTATNRRWVPGPDSCTATKGAVTRSPRRQWRARPAEW
jgi:hypothetical protein